MISSTLAYRLTLSTGGNAPVSVVAPVVASSLPLVTPNIPLAVVLQYTKGDTVAGLYMQKGRTWQKVLPYSVLNDALLAPLSIQVYVDSPVAVPVPEGSTLYMDGGLCGVSEVPIGGQGFWAIVSPLEATGGTPHPSTGANVFQDFVPRLAGSGNYGVLTQWFATTEFTLANFDNSRVVFQEEPYTEEYEMPYSLLRNGETFASLTFVGLEQSFRVDSFTPTSFVPGDILAFSQDEGAMNMPALSILISDRPL